MQWQYKRLFVLVWLIKFDGNNQVYSKVLRPALEKCAFPAGVAGDSEDQQNEILDYMAKLFTQEVK